MYGKFAFVFRTLIQKLFEWQRVFQVNQQMAFSIKYAYKYHMRMKMKICKAAIKNF